MGPGAIQSADSLREAAPLWEAYFLGVLLQRMVLGPHSPSGVQPFPGGHLVVLQAHSGSLVWKQKPSPRCHSAEAPDTIIPHVEASWEKTHLGNSQY